MEDSTMRQNDNGIKFYYVRDEKNAPIMTICLIVLDKEEDYEYKGCSYARGIAMCSPKDNPNKKIGRNIAFERAITAIEEKVYRPHPSSSVKSDFNRHHKELHSERLHNDSMIKGLDHMIGGEAPIDIFKYTGVLAEDSELSMFEKLLFKLEKV